MFQGFSKETITFLQQLEANNNKSWFQAHKQDYENHLFSPMKELVGDLGGLLLTIDPYLEVTPAVNKTISRIYRDTRFSKDKTPFKTSHWITFKRRQEEWKDFPAYFFEISPQTYRYGMGFYCAMPATMAKFRDYIDKNPKEFQKAVSFYSRQSIFTLEGDRYRKVFDPAMSGEIQEWYQRKNFYLVCNRKCDSSLFSKKLADDMMAGFASLADFYRFLIRLRKKMLE